MADWRSEILKQFGEDVIGEAPQSYRQDLRDRRAIDQMLLARPRDRETVSKLVVFCSAHNISVIPYAGGTGLVMGHMIQDASRALMLSVERMASIRAIHPEENVIIVDAGVILEELHQFAQKHDRIFPLTLASQGSARIGGLLATNAGGVNVLRYGNARALCLGIEAVMPDGSVYHGLKRLRKDNAGYDLSQLLIGSEGTLGIITGASLKLFAVPEDQQTALFVVKNPNAAIALLNEFQTKQETHLTGFELISGQALTYLERYLPDVRLPFSEHPEWMVLVELSGARSAGLEDALMVLAEKQLEEGRVLDAVVAQSQAQRNELWEMRESIPLANRARGSVSSHDISVPISKIPNFIEEMSEKIAKLGPLEVNCFGHMGDGNLHFNVFPAGDVKAVDLRELRRSIKMAIHDQVHHYEGSIAAEHGVGRLKVEELERYGDPAHLAAMRAIKAALDPKGIMNPGAVLTGSPK